MRNYTTIFVVSLTIICLLWGAFALFHGVYAVQAQDLLETTPHSNDVMVNATQVEEQFYSGLVLSENDVDWYKFTTTHDGLLEVRAFFDNSQGGLNVWVYSQEGDELKNSTEESSTNYKNCTISMSTSDEIPELTYYVKIERDSSTPDNVNITYQMDVVFITTGDSKGFYISEDYLMKGYRPNTLLLLIEYILLGSIVVLWIQFGVTFINKGRKSKRENEAQGLYYRGLGAFIISVALSESTYIIDLISRDVKEHRFFNEYNSDNTFYSLIPTDYYFVSIVLLLFGLIFLMYPLEKYQYAKKSRVMTYTLIVFLPFAIVLRILEINHDKVGLDLSSRSTPSYLLMMGLWSAVIFVGLIAFLNVIRLYLLLGKKAPKGSQLKKKAHQIIIGLFLWIVSIFSTSWTVKTISDVTSDWGPYSTATTGFIGWFVANKLYYLIPFSMPLFLYIALHLLSVGFTREYAGEE